MSRTTQDKTLKIAGLSWRNPAIRSDRGDNILFECPKWKSGCPPRPCRSRNLQLRLMENRSITSVLEQGGRFYSCMDCWVDRSAGGGICKRSLRGTLFLPSIYRAMVKAMRRAILTALCRHRRPAFRPCWNALNWKKLMWWDPPGAEQSQCFLPPKALKCVHWYCPRRSIPGQTLAQDGYGS
jgi:hypothetical protein